MHPVIELLKIVPLAAAFVGAVLLFLWLAASASTGWFIGFVFAAVIATAIAHAV